MWYLSCSWATYHVLCLIGIQQSSWVGSIILALMVGSAIIVVTYRVPFKSSVFTRYNLLGKILWGAGREDDEIFGASPLQVNYLLC